MFIIWFSTNPGSLSLSLYKVGTLSSQLKMCLIEIRKYAIFLSGLIDLALLESRKVGVLCSFKVQLSLSAHLQ